jgi:hypothetical protein
MVSALAKGYRSIIQVGVNEGLSLKFFLEHSNSNWAWEEFWRRLETNSRIRLLFNAVYVWGKKPDR